MDRISKISVFILLIAIFLSVAIAYYRIIILKDYYIKMETTCSPETERCFVRPCDPSGEECQEKNEGRTHYKIIEIKASRIPECKENTENCLPVSCSNNNDCIEILCDVKNVPEGETCNDAAEYSNEFTEDSDADNASKDETDGSADGGTTFGENK
jgi:hypothetical protein